MSEKSTDRLPHDGWTARIGFPEVMVVAGMLGVLASIFGYWGEPLAGFALGAFYMYSRRDDR